MDSNVEGYDIVDDSALKIPNVLTYRDIMTPEQVDKAEVSIKDMLDKIQTAKSNILNSVGSYVGQDAKSMTLVSMKDLKDATTIVVQIESTLEGGTEGLLDTLVSEYGFTIEDV